MEDRGEQGTEDKGRQAGRSAAIGCDARTCKSVRQTFVVTVSGIWVTASRAEEDVCSAIAESE